MNSLKRHLHGGQVANMARDRTNVFLALSTGFARLRYLACLVWTLRNMRHRGILMEPALDGRVELILWCDPEVIYPMIVGEGAGR
jgi:hypothetical protein